MVNTNCSKGRQKKSLRGERYRTHHAGTSLVRAFRPSVIDYRVMLACLLACLLANILFDISKFCFIYLSRISQIYQKENKIKHFRPLFLPKNKWWHTDAQTGQMTIKKIVRFIGCGIRWYRGRGLWPLKAMSGQRPWYSKTADREYPLWQKEIIKRWQ